MKAAIICFGLEKVSQTLRTSLNRELNGYIDFSNNGKYKYERKGLMENMPHIRPHDSVFIVKKEDKNAVMKVLRKYGAKIESYDIEINTPKLK